MKKKFFLLLIIPILIIVSLTIIICSKKTANIEVYEVSDYVHYKLIDEKITGSTSDKNYVCEVFLQFENTDYEASGSQSSMNYYVKKGFSKIAASDLKVGDKLYFKYNQINQSIPAIAYGSYLYMC